jgi:hypothetical protein
MAVHLYETFLGICTARHLLLKEQVPRLKLSGFVACQLGFAACAAVFNVSISLVHVHLYPVVALTQLYSQPC